MYFYRSTWLFEHSILILDEFKPFMDQRTPITAHLWLQLIVLDICHNIINIQNHQIVLTSYVFEPFSQLEQELFLLILDLGTVFVDIVNKLVVNCTNSVNYNDIDFMFLEEVMERVLVGSVDEVVELFVVLEERSE